MLQKFYALSLIALFAAKKSDLCSMNEYDTTSSGP